MQGYKKKCHALETSIKELQLIHNTANPDASSALAIISQAKGDDDTGGCAGSTGSSKRSAECDAEATVGGGISKRSRPSPQKDEKDAEAAEKCVMEDDAEEIPMEMCVAVLRSRAVEREEEVKRLRSLVQARETEFSTERKQLVGKLMASEQARRESEAALETNDAMWQQLVQNQMAVLQQKIAAQAAQQPSIDPLGGHALPANDEELENEMSGESEICSGKDTQQQQEEGGRDAKENCAEKLEIVVDVKPSVIEEDDELVEGGSDSVDAEQTTGDGMEAAQSAQEEELGAKEVDREGEQGEEEQVEEEHNPKSPTSAPPNSMSPASALVAKWASRRKTIGGASD